jgi:hypothetical protein
MKKFIWVFQGLLINYIVRWPRRAMTVNTRRFFLPLHSSFFPFKITLAVFFFRITRDVFSMQYSIITRDVFSKNYTRRFFRITF